MKKIFGKATIRVAGTGSIEGMQAKLAGAAHEQAQGGKMTAWLERIHEGEKNPITKELNDSNAGERFDPNMVVVMLKAGNRRPFACGYIPRKRPWVGNALDQKRIVRVTGAKIVGLGKNVNYGVELKIAHELAIQEAAAAEAQETEEA